MNKFKSAAAWMDTRKTTQAGSAGAASGVGVLRRCILNSRTAAGAAIAKHDRIHRAGIEPGPHSPTLM